MQRFIIADEGKRGNWPIKTHSGTRKKNELVIYQIEDIPHPPGHVLDVPSTKDFKSETLCVLKKNKNRRYGGYRARCLVLKAGNHIFGS
jgi:hypothetical protein